MGSLTLTLFLYSSSSLSLSSLQFLTKSVTLYSSSSPKVCLNSTLALPPKTPFDHLPKAQPSSIFSAHTYLSPKCFLRIGKSGRIETVRGSGGEEPHPFPDRFSGIAGIRCTQWPVKRAHIIPGLWGLKNWKQ